MSCELQTLPEALIGTTWPGMKIQIPDPDNSGQYLDMTGYEITMQLRKKPNGKVFHDFTINIASPTIYESNVMPWLVEVEEYNYLTDLHIKSPTDVKKQTKRLIFPIVDVITK